MREFAVICSVLAWAIAGDVVAAPSANPSERQGGREDVELPIEGTVTHPDWVQKPTPEEFSNYYPPVPQLLGLGGRTLLECDVTSAGATENCKVLLETPAGLGFGDASISLGRFFRMKPMSVDGQPVGGAKVNIPIGFSPWRPQPPSPETPGPTTPSAKALAMAHRLASLGYSAQRLEAMAKQTRTYLATQFASVTLTEQEQAAIDDYVAAYTSAGATVQIDALADRYAKQFTEQQLADIDRFFESPTGAAWLAGLAAGDAEGADIYNRVQCTVQEAARKTFCAKYECSVAPAPPDPPAEK